MAPLTWATVGSNTLKDVDPADDPLVNPTYPGGAPWHWNGDQGNVMAAYSGGAWSDQSLRLYIMGGGHQDYAGNELYAWDADTAEFSLLTKPTGAIGNEGDLLVDAGDGVYFDGAPRSAHTYNNPVVRKNNNFYPFGGSTFISGGAASTNHYYDPTEPEQGWQRDSPRIGFVSYGSVAYDIGRDVFYCFGGGTTPVRVYDPVADTYDPLPGGGWVPGIQSWSHHHPGMDAILVIRDGFDMQLLDASSTVPTAVITTDPLPAVFDPSNLARNGWVYDSLRNRYLAWPNAGTTLYTLTPPAGDPRTETWTWGQIDAAPDNATTPNPSTYNGGVFGRFWFSEALNCIGVVTTTTSNMQVFALEGCDAE